jgi:hypothetical protein
MSRAARSLCKTAAGTNGDQVMLRLDHIAGAGDDIHAVDVRHTEQCFQTPQAAVAAPVLGQFDRRAGQVAEFLQLALEALEQGKCVRRAAGKSGQHLAAVQAADLAGIGFHHALSQRDLAITADRNVAVPAHRQNGGAVNSLRVVIHRNLVPWGRSQPFQAVRGRRRARGWAAS